MKKLPIIVFLAAISMGIGVLFISLKQTQMPKDPSLKKLQVGEAFVWVKIAQSDEEKRQGLSGVKFMGKDEGMLFIFDRPKAHMFWMKDMNFPLDFIWIRGGKVVDISENVPVLDENGQITRISPNQPVDQILEVNSDFVEKNKIKINDNAALTE